MLKDFTDSAKSLTRNPLGVIGLFLVLVYGLASLVLGLGSSSFESRERLPLILFLVLFPCVVLFAFYRLVSKHHKKLYAPSDFRDERHFVNLQGEEERERKVQEELAALEAQGAQPTPSPDAKSVAPARVALRGRYSEAERLGLLAIEERLGQPLRKHVSVVSNNRQVGFDGLLIRKNEVHLVEVKYYARPMFKREFLEAPLHRAASFLFSQTFDHGRDNAVFWFVVVMDFPREAAPAFIEEVRGSVVSDLFKVEFLFVHFDELAEKFGLGIEDFLTTEQAALLSVDSDQE